MLIPAIFLQAAASACLFPPILSAASGISTPENRALTISLSLAVAPVAGGGLLPAGIALAGDLGSFSSGLAAAGIFALSGMGTDPFSKKEGLLELHLWTKEIWALPDSSSNSQVVE